MYSQGNDASIACQYYCDYVNFASLHPYYVVATLFKQALQHIPLEKFTDDFKYTLDNEKALPNFQTMVQNLVEILQGFTSVFAVLNGIDELAQNNQPAVLLLIVRHMKQHPNIKSFVASRVEEYWIRKAMAAYSTIRLSHSHIAGDIVRYVQDNLDAADTTSPLSRDPILKKEILDALVAGAKGM